MNNIKKNEQGFAVLEVVLIVAVVVLLGVVGNMVYNNHHKSTQNTPIVSSALTITSAKTTSTPTPVDDDKSTFKITELGIKLINVPNSLSDLNYAVNVHGAQDGVTYVYFSTITLSNLDKDCSPTGVAQMGVLNKHIGTYNSGTDLKGGSSGQFIKQLSGYWIEYGHPQAACSANTKTEDLHLSQTKDFQSLVTNPSNIVQL